MAKIVNLRQVRKATIRADKKAEADANAARHGRSKAERMLDAARSDNATRQLDQLKFDDE